MIKIEKIQTYGFEAAIRGMRNPLNSWDKSDSTICPGRDFDDCKATVNKCPRGEDPEFKEDLFCIGESDLDLAGRLIACGTPDRKFLRMIYASMDITAPLYWWKEYDTYKVATVANSCSTMHKIHSAEITLNDFSIDNIEIADDGIDLEDMFINVVADCERLRSLYMETKDRKYWRALIQLLPNSYNQKRTVSLNYETLRGMYYWRKNHKLSEWREFCQVMATLPYAEEFIIN